VSRVRAQVRVPVLASRAEALWYDTARWPTFVDGLAHVDKLEGDWPDAGSRVVWTSTPGGRGRVVERVERYIARSGQVADVEDEQLRGRQEIAFHPDGEECVVVLELDFRLKRRTPVTPVLEALFVRRPVRDALRRTLQRFAVELRADGGS
jgi:hypothetical protein